MEESIARLEKSLGGFCSNIEKRCDGLKQSVERRPIPLDSASSNFVRCLNGRVSSSSTHLNLLHSMCFDTVSFQELLGHCNQLFDNNHAHILHLQHLFNYTPPPPLLYPQQQQQQEEEEDCFSSDHSSSPRLNFNSIQDDHLFDDSMSLHNLGLSDACLATIASQANNKIQMEEEYQATTKFFELTEDELESCEGSGSFITVSHDDYASLPSYMKILASWEDVTAAVEKLNASLAMKEKSQGSYFFGQDEIASLGLGPKGRSYMLMLLRMNKLVIENVDSSVSYKVL